MAHIHSNRPRRPSSSATRTTLPLATESARRDIFSNLKRIEHEVEEFSPRHAKESYLVYADGDVPKDKFTKFYHYLLNVSIVTRWILFIVPILAILWIPGILGLTIFPHAKVWDVKLLWWSVWLSVVWLGWWTSSAATRLLYVIAKSTIAILAVNTRRYVDWIPALHRYIALLGWSLAIWISWTPLIAIRQHVADRGSSAVGLVGRVLFAAFLCSAMLLFEKVLIQWIAQKFHEKSYADRIAKQKFAVRAISTLYQNSSDIPGLSYTLAGHEKHSSGDPTWLLKQVRHSFRKAATTATTALGNVASEIAGSAVLQPNSPQAMVKTALQSANKSRLLSRRLFDSFRKPGADCLYLTDIQPFFSTPEHARHAFTLFDKNKNGDISSEEMEAECLEIHREQLSLEHSMQDLDSAVGKLDDILVSVYLIAAIITVAVALQAQLASIVTATGAFVLTLGWVIGPTAQEVLSSVIFLFIKHPYDVGDRVQINKDIYIVQEINLLSTVFIDGSSAYLQAPNNTLNTLWIQNICRSKEMSENFTFDVAYKTTFNDLERLRDIMLAFLAKEQRDFHAVFDLTVKDFPDQSMMTLSAEIKYKSNWQQDSLKVKRRNKWLCALKTALAEANVYGPKGDPNSIPWPTRYTQVPWELVKEEDNEAATKQASAEYESMKTDWRLSDREATFDSTDRVLEEAISLPVTPVRVLSERSVGGASRRPSMR